MLRKNSKIAVFVTLLALINLNCHAINSYLSTTVPTIMSQLQNNTDELIAQRRTIDITKQALDTLVNKKEISKAEADQAKNSLEAIFAKNIKQASNYQRAVYNMKRPFQFVYNKITDPNASYLERFAYTAAAAVGVAITGYAVYQGGKYAYSFMPEKSDKTFDVLNAAEQQKINTVITLPSADELNAKVEASRDGLIKRHPKLAKKIIDAYAGKDMTPLQVMKEVGPIVNDYFNDYYSKRYREPITMNDRTVRQFTWNVVREILLTTGDIDKDENILRPLVKLYNNKIYLGGVQEEN